MYRLPDIAVARLIEDLTLGGDPQSADAEAEVFLDHPRLKLLERGLMLSIRFGLADGFSEIRLESLDRGEGSAATIFAAGPIEDTLLALGFRHVRRTVTLRQAFTVDQVRVHVLHIEPLGWFCEIRPAQGASPESVERLEERLHLWRFDVEPPVSPNSVNTLVPMLDRFGGRRRLERRVGDGVRPAPERRCANRRAGAADRRDG